MARFKIPFWLDAAKDEELLLLETIDDLKRQRSFSSTIRDGIRLVVDLRAGRVDVLLELFPWVKEALQMPPKSSGGDDLRNEFESLRRLILEQGAIPTAPPNYPMMKAVGGGLKPLPGLKPLSKPTFEDDDMPTLALKKDTSTDAGKNLINSMMSLSH